MRSSGPGQSPAMLKDLAAWSNSWDAADGALTTYADTGVSYSIPAATRVSVVPDGSGVKPMHKDQGPYGAIFSLPPTPGCLWVPSSPMFRGRSAWFSDRILVTGGSIDLHSLLSPHPSNSDQSSWFNYPQPWWGASLCATSAEAGSNQALLDGEPGMSTIGPTPQIIMQTWNSINSIGPTITSPLAPGSLRTLLVMWSVNGFNSFLDVTYRESGTLIAKRTYGGQGNLTPLTAIHTGWVHSNYQTGMAVKQGVPTATELKTVRAWASRLIP